MNDPIGEASDRCSRFIADIIQVCRQHRVLLFVDENTDIEEARFEEQSPNFGYTLDIGDLEYNIRMALWDDLNGVNTSGE